MSDDEDRIREEAHKLWVDAGRPEGLAEKHWAEAKEIIALRDSYGSTLRPVEDTLDDPVEPAVAFENQADVPGLDDLADGRAGPSWDAARDTADVQSLSVDHERKPGDKKRSAQREDAKLPTSIAGSPQKD